MATSVIRGRDVRRIILDQSRRAHVGHIGSALSIADIVAVLYSHVLRIESPLDHDRDRFVLSKGHAALAVYSILHLKGWLRDGQINTFCSDNTMLGVHPEHCLPGVDFATGSLGMGLGYGAGAALAARMQRSSRSVYVLLSDAECNEGAVWEAAMFAGHHKLRNLTAIIDANGQQALGYTRDVINLDRIAESWTALGWDVATVDGHDAKSLREIFDSNRDEPGRPRLILARTVCGKGVSFMEGQIKWHYYPMTEEEHAQAVSEVEGQPV